MREPEAISEILATFGCKFRICSKASQEPGASTTVGKVVLLICQRRTNLEEIEAGQAGGMETLLFCSSQRCNLEIYPGYRGIRHNVQTVKNRLRR